MYYVCPICKTENRLEITFSIGEYICSSCTNIIFVNENTSRKKIRKPVENVVLEVGQKGILLGTEYYVINIVIKKYGQNIFWREYALKDKAGNNVYLSESDGHWVFLSPTDKELHDYQHYAELDGKKYRWYETTPCNTYSATGFFEDKVNLALSNYKEYVNGTTMISREQTGSDLEYFHGKHISRYTVKRAFKIKNLPNYTGIGIVQPFYVDLKQAINILGLVALIICLLQLYVFTSRTNKTVFEQEINFADVHNKELVSNSFKLSGGSAPLRVNAYSNVDNSWANVEISLVNEKNNEIIYTSKDIEQYHGVDGGESWSEGSKSETFNFCGVSQGDYHFLISAEKESGVNIVNSYSDPNKLKEELTKLNPSDMKSIDNFYSSLNDSNPSVKIKATWLPVSFWNFGIILFCIVILVIAFYIGKRFFEVSKWANSSNSSY
ncbi:DUF4178 domain-containing protein [Chryseobacterium sp.]|uniref:DUF4178 domain-containing protein n=1 Tax=Chryseobacterium sp. TaxID=1871047 RepID=UPI0025B7E18B|nr:DUF4178 domain-containing protein [Chryseobacterium sp.]